MQVRDTAAVLRYVIGGEKQADHRVITAGLLTAIGYIACDFAQGKAAEGIRGLATAYGGTLDCLREVIPVVLGTLGRPLF